MCILDAHGRVVRVFVTSGTTNDSKLGIQLFQGLDILGLLADKGYDTNAIIEFARACGIEICIPPKKNRKEQREYDEKMYRHRHIVENVFLLLKQWRGIATRYAKLTSSYLAAIHLRCLYCYFN